MIASPPSLTSPAPASACLALTRRTLRVAVLGCGTVGSALSRRLLEPPVRARVELAHVLVRDPRRDRGLPPGLLTDRFERVLDGGPDLVVELIGGLYPAGAFVAEALRRGIGVVTANKTLLAHHGAELHALAREHRAPLAAEASVCSAVPVLAALARLSAAGITRVRGVVNGTCNSILCAMADRGWSFEQALADATRRGLAEPDPHADVSGRDSAEKLCVLASACGVEGLVPDLVRTEGIERVTLEDIAEARRRGRRIRLVASLDLRGGPRACVAPTLVPLGGPVARAEGPENVVLIETQRAGTFTLRGRGAGPEATAAAVLGDVQATLGLGPIPTMLDASPVSDDRCRRHIRVRGPGHRLTPQHVSASLGRAGVRAIEVELGTAAVRIETDRASEEEARAAADLLAANAVGDSLIMPVE
ncbi:MAG: homoserine dehydrogenase [Phycisphaerae bacterium]|nr:homoserine dehydrogenase [Phycisphaerae bacterium]